MSYRRLLPWIVLTAVAGLAAGALVARMLAQKSPALQSGTWLPEAHELAPFRLTDLDGRAFGNAELQGHPSLLFFGFSNCPDICPTTLATLSALQSRAPLPGLRVVFITVDPERDTPAVLKAYLAAFSGAFIGLYGGNELLAPLMRSVGSIAARQPQADGSYTVDHSATLYLLDSRGRMAAVFTPPYTAAALEADLLAMARAGAL